jgi:hypothetical protein
VAADAGTGPSDRISFSAPAGDAGHVAIWVVAANEREVRGTELTDLVRDCGEHRVRRRAARDERSYAPKGGLLLDKRVQVVTGLRVGDRCRDELRERGQALLGPVAEPIFGGWRTRSSRPTGAPRR